MLSFATDETSHCHEANIRTSHAAEKRFCGFLSSGPGFVPRKQLYFVLYDNIISNISSKRDRFQLRGVCKQKNNDVTLEAFLRLYRGLRIRRRVYQPDFSFLQLIQN